MRLILLAATLLAAVTSGAYAARGEMEFEGFPFRIPYDGLVGGTAPADLARARGTAGADGFVRVAGDRFVAGESDQAIRFWGTNLCFAGCFPPHDVAERMARRLSSLGFNCVRFHHMDAHGWPNGIWDTENRWGNFKHNGLHPEALDRLDYLTAQLKKHGIYVNLNLHVSRTYGPADGFPAASQGESVPKFGKGVGNYFPACIAEQKRYARMLLRHVNRYTGKPYAEEPAVAMVEISNEDGLLGAWQRGWLDNLPEAYIDALEAQWNRWLRAQYGSTDELRKTWAAGRKPGGGEDLLAASRVRGRLQTIGATRATLEESTGPDNRPISIITVQRGSRDLWHVQYSWGPTAVEKGQTYVLRLRLRANRADEVRLNCMMNHEPWQQVGLTRALPVGPEWRDYEFFFVASRGEALGPDSSGGARVTLSGLAKDGLQVAATRPTLQRAAVDGLRDREGLEKGVDWPQRDEFATRTPAVRRDVVRFVHDAEADYWSGMCEFLHEELGVRMPVTGTAVGFTTPHVAAETVDFVDSHAYWQHPRFPGRPWDRENWFVVNDVMVNTPERSTVATLAGRRVFGRPFTVTEYNHPSPHCYEAEGFPLISAYGSLQSWDGVFVFGYCHNDQWETERLEHFFDIKANPVKLALQPACAAVLRGRSVGPAADAAVGHLSVEQRLQLLMSQGPRAVTAYGGGVPEDAWRSAMVGVDAGLGGPAHGEGQGGVEWQVRDGRGLVRFQGPGSAGLVGFGQGRSLTRTGFHLAPGETSLDGFSVVLLNAVDGQSLGEPGRYLVTAVVRCENRNMGWNAARNSVGTDWGDPPPLCEGVPLRLSLRNAGQTVRAFSLEPDGTRREEVPPVVGGGDVTAFRLGPEHRTLWYEVVVEE